MKNAEGLETTFGGFLTQGRLFADLIRPSFVESIENHVER